MGWYIIHVWRGVDPKLLKFKSAKARDRKAAELAEDDRDSVVPLNITDGRPMLIGLSEAVAAERVVATHYRNSPEKRIPKGLRCGPI